MFNRIKAEAECILFLCAGQQTNRQACQKLLRSKWFNEQLWNKMVELQLDSKLCMSSVEEFSNKTFPQLSKEESIAELDLLLEALEDPFHPVCSLVELMFENSDGEISVAIETAMVEIRSSKSIESQKIDELFSAIESELWSIHDAWEKSEADMVA